MKNLPSQRHHFYRGRAYLRRLFLGYCFPLRGNRKG